MKITIPDLSLVVLIGASGAGKSTFAKKHFLATEVISSDFCRGLVSDDENNQAASKDAFEVLRYISAKRLAAGKLTVIDATNVKAEDRKTLINLAREYHVLPVAIALKLPEKLCYERNQQRPNRNFGFQVVHRHTREMLRSLGRLRQEGFRHVCILSSEEEIDAVVIERYPLYNNLKQETGPFDIIGDIHGCCDELESLLQKLGYESTFNNDIPSWWQAPIYRHPQGRKVIFLGDLVDRGPRILDTIKIVRNMMLAGTAFCIMGNHEQKFLRKLQGKNVKVNYGLAQSLAEIESLPEEIKEPCTKEIADFLDSLISHYVLDGGKLVVAHAGMKESMQGRASKAVREFALYGETTGETDEFGLPVRYPWATDYRGQAAVVYGHTPVLEPEWLNNTIDVDTGCVYGGKLTALRYPERELVSTAAARVYRESAKPFLTPVETVLTSQQELDDVLDLEDVLGNLFIDTRLQPKIKVKEEQAIAALEVMSRFAANPKWLIYLPPTMSPCETSNQEGLLEHPAEAFDYYQHNGISQVVCEKKHMGSRAIVVVCRDEKTAQQRFGVIDDGAGICYTRTGRRFFNDSHLEKQLIARLQKALETQGFWQEFETDWVLLDCELMPWSVKAQSLIRQQYAAVGAAAKVSLNAATTLLEKAAARGIEVDEVLSSSQQRASLINQYTEAYRRYCWEVNSLADIKLAPFHLLATEGKVHVDQSHLWHLEKLANICRGDEDLLMATDYQVVDLSDAESKKAAISWWENLTEAGDEGMVVKPLDFIAKQKFLLQPAIKCRGKEYLRIIYGAEYTLSDNLQRLRQRGLGRKRSLALREFSLGIEALERFINHQPLRRVHQCVFAILALNTEPVDPRL